MLYDYYNFITYHPCDADEITHDLEKMRDIYIKNPSKSSLLRLNAYSEGTQEKFLSQIAEIIICQKCDAQCYHIGTLEYTPVCSQCHRDDTILYNISVGDIPAWIDIDNFQLH